MPKLQNPNDDWQETNINFSTSYAGKSLESLISAATALGVQPELIEAARRTGALEQSIRSGQQITPQGLQEAGYRPASKNLAYNQNNQEIRQMIDRINKQLDSLKIQGQETGYRLETEFEPSPMGGHYKVQVVRVSTQESNKYRHVRVGGKLIDRDTGEEVVGGQTTTLDPVSEPFRLGAIQGTPVVGALGSGTNYALKDASVRKGKDLKSLSDYLTHYVVQHANDLTSRFKDGSKSLLQKLELTGDNFTSIDSSIQYRTPAGKGAELSRYSGRPTDAEGATYFDSDMTGSTSKGATLPFGSVHLQIPGYIQDELGKLYLGNEGLAKDATKRPRLHLRDYTPIAAKKGQPVPEVRANFAWSKQRERETAVAIPKALFFTEQVFPEGQGIMSPKLANYVTESFADSPEKYRIPAMPGVTEEQIRESLGLNDGPRRISPGEKVTGYPGHRGTDVIRNFESATLTGFDIINAQDDKGEFGQYIQLQGHRDTSIGGSAALKFGGIKSLMMSQDPADLGLPGLAAFNAPSSSLQFMANVLNYMPRQELEAYWAQVHGVNESDRPEIPSHISTLGDMEQVKAVYLKYLEDNYSEYNVNKTVTSHELARLQENAPNRLVSNSLAGKTTTGEQLHNITVKTGGYLLPIGAKMVRESSDQSSVRMSFEEGSFFKQMGLGQIWDKIRGEGKGYRRAFDAIAESVALNAGLPAKADRPMFDLDELSRDKEFTRQWQNIYEEQSKALMPQDFQENLKNLSAKEQKKASTELRRNIENRAIQEMFGSDALLKIGGKWIAAPGLMERFSFNDPGTNQTINKLQDMTAENIVALMNGNRPDSSMVAKTQADLLETGGGRDAWLSGRTKRGIEGTYLSHDAVGTNETLTSYKAISDMFGLHDVGIDWRTKEGKTAIDNLSRENALLETGMRNPTSDPRRTAGLVRNFITEGIMRERGVDLSLGTSRSVYNNPAWVWSQGGDNDSDRLRMFAASAFYKIANKLGVQKFAGLSSVEDILYAARTNPAGEMQDYEKKLRQGNAGKFTNLGSTGYDPKQLADKTRASSELIQAQTGPTYNYFRRILPMLASGASKETQDLIGMASATYFQPLIDQKPYDPAGKPQEKSTADFISFLSSYDPIRRKYESASGEWRQKLNLKEGGAGEILRLLQGMHTGSNADQLAAMVAPVGNQNVFDALQKAIGKGELTRDMYRKLTGEEFADSQNSPLAILYRGQAHTNAKKQLESFKQNIENEKLGLTNVPIRSITEYASIIDNAMSGMPEELQAKWKKKVSDRIGNQSVFSGIVDPFNKRQMTEEQVRAILKPEMIASALEQTLPHFNQMKDTAEDFNMLSGIMGGVAKEKNPQRQSAFGLITNPILQWLGAVPRMAPDIKKFAAGEKDIDEPTAAIIGEGTSKEDVVPHDKAKQVGRYRVYDPNSLGAGAPPPPPMDDFVIDPETGQPISLSPGKPTPPTIKQRGGYAIGEAMGFNPLRHAETVGTPPWEVTSLQKATRKSSGNGGQPPATPPTDQTTPEGGNIIRKEVTSYAQPFSEKLVQQYETLAAKLQKYGDTIEALNASGATMADVQGKLAPVIKAAGNVYHRLEGQYSRAQRILRYDELETQYSASQRGEGDISSADFDELMKMREQFPQRPAGAEIALAGRAKAAMQQIFPIYAAREQAGRKGTRLPPEKISQSWLAQAAAIAGRDPSEVKDAMKQEREDISLGRIDRRLEQTTAWYDALEQGRGQAFGSDRVGVKGRAEEVSQLQRSRQSLYEQFVPLRQQYDDAMQRGDTRQAQKLYDQMTPLTTQMAELKESVSMLTPNIKEHVDALKTQTSFLKEEISERKKLYGDYSTRHDELSRQAITARGSEKIGLEKEIQQVRGRMTELSGEISDRATRVGQLTREQQVLTDKLHEPSGGAVRALGARPLTAMQQAGQELAQGYDPQRLFWQFQNIEQLRFMAFNPMLQMRNQYLQEQATIGQAQYALGGGQMPESVLRQQTAAANTNRFMTAIGKGVDSSAAMRMWQGFTGNMAENEGGAEWLGSAGFNTLGTLTAFGLGKMALWPLMKSGWAATQGLRTAGSTAAQAAQATQLNRLSYFTGNSATLDAGATAATTAGGITLGGAATAGVLGLGAGLAGYEFGARPIAQAMGRAAPSLGQFATVGAYGLGGMDIQAQDFLTLGGSFLGRRLAGVPMWNQDKANQWGEAVGQSTGAVDTSNPIPVWITKIEEGVRKELGGQMPFSREEIAQLGQALAETRGLKASDLANPETLKKVVNEFAESARSGVSVMQSIDIQQKAVKASGFAPGTRQAESVADWANQGSYFQRQQRLEAVDLAQQATGFMGMNELQSNSLRQNLLGLRQGGASEFDIRRYLSQVTMGNQYDYSAAAYASSNGQLAMMDQAEPWRPKYQKEIWGIEDRRRQEDQTTSFGREDYQLNFQRTRMQLEEDFWAFRKKSQQEDFEIGQKFFDFQIKQMRYGMEQEEKRSEMTNRYQERQFEVSKQIFDLQGKYRLEDFDKQEARMGTQRGWQLEDFATNRSTFELQSGWQQEDLERALRYSSGRERIDIRRQMERAGTMADIKRGEMDRQEDRASVQYGWAQDDLATNRNRFEEMRTLQEEQMNLGRQYWQEQKQFSEEDRATRNAMMNEQITLMTERNAINVAQYNEQRTLADAQHALELNYANQKLTWQQEDLARARERAKEDEKMLGWQRQLTEAQQKYAAYAQQGLAWIKQYVPELEKAAQAAQKLADMQAGTPMPRGVPRNAPNSSAAMFAKGGPTNTPTFAVLSEYGQEEYVVPQHGALVKKESSSNDAQLLQKIVDLLSAGGGKIMIDKDSLKENGFLHIDEVSSAYH